MKYENETEQEVVSARISCQYEIMSVEDLTKDMPINDQENFWVIEKPYPSKAEVFIIIVSYPKIFPIITYISDFGNG